MTKDTEKTKNPRKAGRKPLPKGETKATVIFYPLLKMVDAIGYEQCQQLALESIQKEYFKIKSETEL